MLSAILKSRLGLVTSENNPGDRVCIMQIPKKFKQFFSVLKNHHDGCSVIQTSPYSQMDEKLVAIIVIFYSFDIISAP